MKTSSDQQPALPGFEKLVSEPVREPRKSFVCGQPVNADFRVSRTIFRSLNSDFQVFLVETEGYSPITCSACTGVPIEVGRTVRIVGTVTYWKDRLSIKADSLVPSRKLRKPGVVAYLTNNYHGIGQKTAERIFDMFGDSTFDVVENHPEKLIAVDGVGGATIDAIRNAAKSDATKRDVLTFLYGIGVTKGISRMIWERYGDKTKAAVTKNPYILTSIGGIGFRRADDIAAGLGFTKDAPERIREGLLYALEYECTKSGHCYIEQKDLIKSASDILGVNPETELDWLGHCDRVRFDGSHVYPKRLYTDEVDVAAMFERIMRRGVGKVRQARSTLKLSPDQKKAVLSALSEKVCIITGGPGSGKTTVLELIARSFYKKGFEIALASPTGRAAKRLEEVTKFPAQTIHRLLQVDRNGNFRKNLQEKLEADVVIVDESSMIDISLAANLLRAIRSDSRVIFVGDSDQLPSVGPGNFLRDMIASGRIPVSRLTHIHRQKEGSEIAAVSSKVNSGTAFAPVDGDEFGFFNYSSPDGLADDLEIRLLGLKGCDCQVLTPVHMGEFGTNVLNRRFQSLLNPPGKGKAEIHYGNNVFRVGDKVIQEVNDYDLGVMNGSVGVVKGISDYTMTVGFDTDVEYPRDRLENLSLAYAITIHKSQGSEYENVVLVMYGVTPIMHERNMLYTGMTRASRHLYVYGSRKDIWACVRRNKADARHTNLKNLLEGSIR